MRICFANDKFFKKEKSMQKTIKTLAFWLIFTQIGAGQMMLEKNYYLLFSAREASLRPFSLAGHAFVSWGIDSTVEHKIALPLTLGFYPSEKTDIIEEITGNKRGRLVRGWFKNSTNRKSIITLILSTDSLTWEIAKQTADGWHTKGYNLLDRNCVKFMDAIAETAQLRTPRVRMILGFPRRPTNYLRRLAKKNKQHIFEKTTHFYKKDPNGDAILPLDIDLNEIRRSEKISKNGKPVGQ